MTIAGSSLAGSDEDDGTRAESGDIRSEQATLTKDGRLALQLETKRDAGLPYVYRLEGDVEDASRQHIANRASITVHPAPWYVGLRRPSYFLEQKAGLQTEIVTVGLDGTPVAGVPVEVTLTQVQWTSVRRAEGNGFYTWDTERKLVPAGKWTVTTAAASGAAGDPVRQRRLLHPGSNGSRRRWPVRGHADILLRARRRLYRVGSASTTTASSSCPSVRPTSLATPPAS